eukprot:344517-Chlamydomonas_euryale.AAC.8
MAGGIGQEFTPISVLSAAVQEKARTRPTRIGASLCSVQTKSICGRTSARYRCCCKSDSDSTIAHDKIGVVCPGPR